MSEKKSSKKSGKTSEKTKKAPKTKGASTLAKKAGRALKQEAEHQVRKRFGILGRLLGIKVLVILLVLLGLGSVTATFIPEEKVPPALEKIHSFLLAKRNYAIRRMNLPFSGYEDAYTIDVPSRDPLKLFLAPSPVITKELCKLIDSAVNSVDVCAFDIKLHAVADALIRAHKNKVRVRVVTETDYLKNPALNRISKAGIEVVSDYRSGLMHNKFVIVDHRYLWTGSFNFTDNGQRKNDNNAILLESSQLAAAYEERFEQYFSGKFGKKGKRSSSQVSFSGPLVLKHGFSPSDKVTQMLLAELATAQKSVDIMAFSFTNADLAQKLYSLHRKGVRIRCLYDYGQAKNKASKDEEMRKKGLKVYYSPNRRGKMHHKVMIIDRQTVITGSFNFSKNAERTNDENILILRSRALAEIYLREMARCIKGIKGY